jgi:hypothetical protein
VEGDAAWEVGRLVLAPQYRAGPEALKRCLFLALLYLIRNVEITDLFATCNPILGRLYRRFAFSTVVKDALTTSEGSYSLIHGLVPQVLLALAGTPTEAALAERELDKHLQLS